MSVGLTKDQLEQFEKDGLLVIDNFLSPEEVIAIRKELRNRIYLKTRPGSIRSSPRYGLSTPYR